MFRVIDVGGLRQFFQMRRIPESIGDFIILLAFIGLYGHREGVETMTNTMTNTSDSTGDKDKIKLDKIMK